MTSTNLKLDGDMAERVYRLAEAGQRSPHELMREAISRYVEREEERQALDRDTLAAWENYQATGLHLTGDEVDAWLARLEAGEDVPPPECHT